MSSIYYFSKLITVNQDLLGGYIDYNFTDPTILPTGAPYTIITSISNLHIYYNPGVNPQGILLNAFSTDWITFTIRIY